MAYYTWTWVIQCSNGAEYNIWKAYMLTHPAMYPGMQVTYNNSNKTITVVCYVENF